MGPEVPDAPKAGGSSGGQEGVVVKRLHLREDYAPELVNQEAVVVNALHLVRNATPEMLDNANRAILAGAAAMFEELANACRAMLKKGAPKKKRGSGRTKG